jgi:hypothetical protein
MIAQTYREMFLELNRPLPAETVYKYLTRSLKQDNREELVAQFTELYGVAKPVIVERRESDDSLMKRRTLMIPDSDIEINTTSKKIMEDWLERARLRRRLRLQVTKFITQSKTKICDKCKGSAWLKSEYEDEILNLFDSFIREENEDPKNYNILAWRRYFRRNATINTSCIDCRVPSLSIRTKTLLTSWLSVARERLNNQ